MRTVSIPGWGSLHLKNVVLDLNGTITHSGEFIPGVLDSLEALTTEGFDVFVLSGDTRGTLKRIFSTTREISVVITKTALEKRSFVESLGAEQTVCVGNGNIDIEMFKVAGLSICTIQAEGAATKAIREADIVVTDIEHALQILLDPEKLIATLRA
jgi:soluble P-type ATPase